jgi:hypothetical protein
MAPDRKTGIAYIDTLTAIKNAAKSLQDVDDRKSLLEGFRRLQDLFSNLQSEIDSALVIEDVPSPLESLETNMKVLFEENCRVTLDQNLILHRVTKIRAMEPDQVVGWASTQGTSWYTYKGMAAKTFDKAVRRCRMRKYKHYPATITKLGDLAEKGLKSQEYLDFLEGLKNLISKVEEEEKSTMPNHSATKKRSFDEMQGGGSSLRDGATYSPKFLLSRADLATFFAESSTEKFQWICKKPPGAVGLIVLGPDDLQDLIIRTKSTVGHPYSIQDCPSNISNIL